MDKDYTSGEVLLLSDGTGTYYALPLEVLEQHKISDDQKQAVEEVFGNDVSGFGLYDNYLTEMRAQSHQANLRYEADQHRLASSADSDEPNTEQVAAPRRRFFTGVFAHLRVLRPHAPKQRP